MVQWHGAFAWLSDPQSPLGLRDMLGEAFFFFALEWFAVAMPGDRSIPVNDKTLQSYFPQSQACSSRSHSRPSVMLLEPGRFQIAPGVGICLRKVS